MEISIKALALFITILLTGLSAGLFFAWEISVIPGTKKVSDTTYIETMQAINRAIINPAFMVIFMGTLLMQIISVYQFRGTSPFWWMLAATLIYAAGTVGVTMLGNVPLNDSLDATRLADFSSEQIESIRSSYERPWNWLHTVRTFFAVISFTLMQLAAFLYSQF